MLCYITLRYRQHWTLIIKFLEIFKFKVSQHLCFWFYLTNSLFCSPGHKTATHFFSNLSLNRVINNILLRACTYFFAMISIVAKKLLTDERVFSQWNDILLFPYNFPSLIKHPSSLTHVFLNTCFINYPASSLTLLFWSHEIMLTVPLI